MSLSSRKLLRLFVLLLLTVFISETVYASGMMASVQVIPSHTEASAELCHDVPNAQQAHEKQHAHASCKDCSHCFACFSMMIQAPLIAPTLKKQLIATTLFVEIYHSPSTIQPQKPPIA
ncbi:MAG: hypothetical protein PSV17_04070 [Methylotenera sp.]|uniref:hypothetical protein n=1 Tax=Methylotenera sp. TaxID=2051956 RepID=UPI002489251B|nr:hypothetical protein [Methylotenera sp.]MDI1308595.1 hypothetical protein [Methylotenera sp.]